MGQATAARLRERAGVQRDFCRCGNVHQITDK